MQFCAVFPVSYSASLHRDAVLKNYDVFFLLGTFSQERLEIPLSLQSIDQVRARIVVAQPFDARTQTSSTSNAEVAHMIIHVITTKLNSVARKAGNLSRAADATR
jgi:hypothetical protein